MNFRYTITFRTWSSSHGTIADTVSFLDKWRHREGGWLRVTAYSYDPIDSDDDGLTQDERDCVNCPPCAARDELVAEIDSAAEAA